MLDEEERQGRSGCLEDEDGFTRPLAPPPSGNCRPFCLEDEDGLRIHHASGNITTKFL